MAAVAGQTSRHAVMTEAPSDRIFARYLEWIQDCKEAIHTLRMCIKQARAYREKCCSVLGAALGAALALEQAVYSGTLHRGKAQELQQLCAAVTAAIELAQQRVQVYGSQSGIRKYASLARRSAIEAKFSQVVERLEKLTKQAWILQNSSKPVDIQQDMRLHANSRLEESSLQLANTGFLTRSRLRRGCLCHTVQSVLYVGHTQGKNDSANTSGQIWWCLTSSTSSKLFAHDLATSITSKLQSFQSGALPAVTCMQVDSQGYVWMGFKGGMLQVWDADRRACLCQGLDMAPADVRVIIADSESMWVGTDRGRLSQLRLTAQKSDTGLDYYTDLVQTLQLAQAHGISHVTAATSATLGPVAPQPQLTTPFAQKPPLTLSSSASSYHDSGAAVEVALSNERQLPQPAAASASSRAVLEGRNPEASSPLFTPFSRQPSRQPSGHFSGQPLSSFPLLGPGSNPLGRPPNQPPYRTMSAELMHASTLLTHTATPGNRSKSMSPTESPKLDQTQRQLPAAGQLPTVQSELGDLAPILTAAHRSQGLPVQAVAVVGGRVVISMQAKASASLQEWSFDGELLMNHACNDLGAVTCIAPVPDLVRHQPLPSSAFPLPSQKVSEAAIWQRLTRLSSTSPDQKQPKAATWQLLTGHVSGHLKLWQGSQQNLLQPLAVIRAVGDSPVKSLVILQQLQAVCSAHANGQIMLCVMPDQLAELQGLPSQQAGDGQPLPSQPTGEGQPLHLLPLASTRFQAHRSGLRMCVAGDSGLVSVGAFGSMMVWPEAELRSVAHAAGLCLTDRYDGTVAAAGATDTRPHMSQLLERFFTPRSAKAVEKALGAMSQQFAQEEEAQGHRLSPGLAALQRGDLNSLHDAPGVLKEVVHLLNLSHADSNDLPLGAHQPGAPARSSLGYQGGTENLPMGYQGVAEASPEGVPLIQQGMLNSLSLVEHTALSPTDQPLHQCQDSRPELLDLLRGPSTEPQYSHRESYEYSQSYRAGSVYSVGTAHDFASARSHDLQHPLMRNSGEPGHRSSVDPESVPQQPGEAAQGPFADAQRRSGEFVDRTSPDSQQAQQPPHEMVRCMSKEQLACQQATYWSAWPPQTEEDKRLQRRVSFPDDVDFRNAAATAASHAESGQPEESHPEPARAGPPPSAADYSNIVQVQQDEALPSAAQLSAFYHSVTALLPRRGSTTSEQSMAHSSPAGSTQRGASQLLRLESRASDLFSNPTSSRQNSLTLPDSALAISARAPSRSLSRVTRDSLHSHQSINHSPSESAIYEAHVMHSRGGGGGSGLQSVKSSGGPSNLDHSSLSILQGIEQVTVAPQGIPRSQSHMNLRQGLDRIPADSQPEPDSSAPAVATAGQHMHRSKSKLGLDTLASVESMNCLIIDYSQLEIKRKIGDGSTGQVYLGKWQETDVAVKVLTEMQNLSSFEGVHPQDPSNMETWEAHGPRPRQGGEKTTKGAGLTGSDSHGWGSDDDASSIGADPEVVPSEERQEALRTLEREVSIMAALRHPNVVMFMGLCLEPPCIVTEFCARGSLYDVLKKARGTPAFAQQLDWSRRISMALDAAKGVLQLHSHKPPILHRDLKSPNMLVDRHWRVKVTDFNLSRMVKAGSSNASVTSMLANNPRWLAPEVVSKHDYSKAADVYSFGIILWEMMTWRLPWEDLNPFQIMLVLTQQHDRPEVPPLDTLPGQPLPGIDDYIGLMQDCWREDASKRPRFEDIIISLRGLLENANNRHKLQKTLTVVPRLLTSCAVPPNMNKLAVVGQTPFGGSGADPQQTPTPLEGQAKPGPLQVYETNRPFFGSTPVGGLDIMTSSQQGTGKGGGGSDYQKDPISGGQSQQQILQNALRHKGRSPTRRHTFGGTATNFGDQFDTAPSIFTNKASVEGANRRKSLSAAPRFGQSAVPAWLRAKRAAAAGLVSVSENLQTAATGSASKAQQCQQGTVHQGTAGTAQASSQPASASDTEAPYGSQAGTQQAAAVDAAEEGRSSGPVAEARGREQGSPVRSSVSQVLGSLSQAKGSITQVIGSIGQVIGSTPFSAFAQQNLRAHNSSDDSESDKLPFKHHSAQPSSVEESGGGDSLTKRKSGPFGGRGVALGHMMAAQQQWRQDSFSKAQQERRNSEESIRNGGENENTRLTSRDTGDHKHHGRAESGNNAEGRRPVGGSTGDASDDDHFIGWRPRQAQRCEMLGKSGSASIESLDATGSGSETHSPTGLAQAEDASPAHTAGAAQPGIRSTKAVADLPATIATAAPTPVNAYVNPFLAASQNWHPCDSDESSAEESGLSTSSPSEPSRQLLSVANPFAAAAEQWLAARQNCLAESDASNSGQEKPPASQAAAATAARHSSRKVSDHSSHGRPVGSPKGQHRQERIGEKHMVASQADQEMRSPFEVSQLQQRSPGARAGLPPAKDAFQNSLAESSASGESAAYCTRHHTSHKSVNMITCFVP
ncbi:TPA: hypothetical protein ACH3X1_000077 [Trebouxia sp. C0004]